MIKRAIVLLITCAFTLRAAESGSYLNFDVGLNLASDVEFDASVLGLTGSGTSSLDPGFRIGVAPGFILNRLMSLELETGFVYNTVDNRGVNDVEEWYGQIPILLNVVFRYDCECGWTPFIGLGGGGSASILDVSISTPEASQTETDVKFVAAWQAMAGIRYRFTENFGLGFVYKYFGTEAPNFDILGVELELDPVHNHYFGLQLNYNY